VDYAATGDRYVAELMRRYGYSLGGEKSGHIILPGIEPTGNGLVTALKVLEIMSNTGKGISQLNYLKEYPQILLNVAVKSKPALDGLESVQHAIKEIEGRIADNGRVFVRYSGTEELCRIMVEGESEKLISEYANRIAEAIKKVIG
jgi:phosphoglucosamine mutase